IRLPLCEVGGQNEACPPCRLRTGGHATALPTLRSTIMGMLLNLRSLRQYSNPYLWTAENSTGNNFKQIALGDCGRHYCNLCGLLCHESNHELYESRYLSRNISI
ncbi:MAG: hypothetical protein Q8R24_03520, partial [Legionellaceae bacterium]|nr:hypothetical protein [Legionellaceae bacterium]